jgi:HK97 family phage prohead protease
MVKELSKNKIFKVDSTIEKFETDSDTNSIIIEGYASTGAVDRASDIILPSAWNKGGLDNYASNPVLLFNHDYHKPIGKAVSYVADDKGLRIRGAISKGASGNVAQLIEDGVLSTFSVGFLIKDADWDRELEGFIIKDAELLEISVVSVPCNPGATFSVAKSFDSDSEYETFKTQFIETSLDQSDGSSEGDNNVTPEENTKMDPETLNQMIADAIATNEKAKQAEATKAADAAAVKAAEEEKFAKTVATVISSSEERLMGELEKRFKDNNSNSDVIDLKEKLAGLETALSEKTDALQKMLDSKRKFTDLGDSGDWQKKFTPEMEDAFMLARVTGKGYETKFAQNLMEKVNAHSSVTVSSADFEQTVSTNIERDIQNELILAPLFREIQLNSASMIIPIMPDSGYAEITASAGSTTGTNPNGTLDTRGGTDRGGVALSEIELRTVKMVAKSYLGNETEEDAIMPILPLLRESMVRQHARGVENLILLGGHADGAYSGVTAASGLLKYASTNSRSINTGTAATLPALTAAKLLELRKNMGKYGIRANDVVYIVSQRAYFELLEDPEFQDFNLVNTMATKLNGEIGQVYGSSVMLCDEFPGAAATKFYAMAVNVRNFVIPRQRGVTVESDYSVEDQHRVLVTTQRLGFKEIIPNATSVFGYAYPAAS